MQDDSKTIDEGAVVVWGTLMWSLMKDIVRTMGVRTDVSFRDLSPAEKEIVYHGELKKTSYSLRQSEHAGTGGDGF